MNITDSQVDVLTAYVRAIKAYARLCKASEEHPTSHLNTLMHAERLMEMSNTVIEILELPND